jgi:YegS/Rv2252/BmrU family lipid kinase
MKAFKAQSMNDAPAPTGDPAKKYFLIANPSAGHRKLGRKWKSEIHPFLKDTLRDFDFRFTNGPLNAITLTRQALHAGYETIVAMGGDGTLNEVVNGFFEHGSPINPQASLSLLPFGSGGDFTRTVQIPRQYQSAAESLLNASERRIDVGIVEFANKKFPPRYFLNIADAGVVANVMHFVNATPRVLPSLLRYLWGACFGFLTYSNIPVRVTLDGMRRFEVELTNLIVGNGRYFGRGMNPTPFAELDDGLFDILIFKNANLFSFLKRLPGLYGGKVTPESHRHETHRAREILIEPLDPKKKLWIEMDGETYGEGAVTFRVLPRAIKFASE